MVLAALVESCWLTITDERYSTKVSDVKEILIGLDF
jgi:hypothetical protein